ncbi:hypothetical protein LTR84_008444 [Exophiala bonariae]|uniref:PEP phosphonomutase n=1 Tax=Exophiala bonariae TaxID=1690606 RepID=A0AAV9MXV3_9EURO|nr:hypothetical protein LTR84_008444 [Exophiala bonariae]
MSALRQVFKASRISTSLPRRRLFRRHTSINTVQLPQFNQPKAPFSTTGTMAHSNLNKTALALKALHVPGQPVIMANVWDVASTRTVGSLPSAKALATASYAVALANDSEDALMTLETNLAAARAIGKVAVELEKPLSVDLQDGYGARLEEAIQGVIAAGAVGVNIEDVDKDTGVQYAPEEAAERIRKAVAVAKGEGVPDFVVNARCDTILKGSGDFDETIQRGKLYLEAGATTVFVIGGSGRGGLTTDEVKRLSTALDGRLNASVVFAEGKLTAKELGDIGISRISIGPQLYFKAMQAAKAEAEKLLSRA